MIPPANSRSERVSAPERGFYLAATMHARVGRGPPYGLIVSTMPL